VDPPRFLKQTASVFAHLLLFLGIVGWVLAARPHMLFWYVDGGVLLDILRSQSTWLGTHFGLTIDPIRGPFNFFSAGNYRMLPLFLLHDLVLGSDVQPVWIYMGYMAATSVSLVAAACLLGLSPLVGILAAWIMAVISLPLFWGQGMLTFPMFIVAPQYFEWGLAFVWSVLGFVFLRNATWTLAALISSAIGIYLLYLFVLVPPTIAVLLPPLLAAYALLTVLSRDRREFMLKLFALTWVGAILIAGGVFQFATALASFNPAAFFLSEIPRYQSDLASASIIYAWERYPVGALLSLVCGIGSAVMVLLRHREVRTSLLVQCAAVTMTLTIGVWAVGPILRLVDASFFKLPFIYTLRLLYWEFPFLPATTLAAAAVAVAAEGVTGRWIGRWTRVGAAIAASPHSLILAIAALVAVRFQIAGTLEGYNPYGRQRDTEITTILRREIALRPGSAFNGRVATMLTSGSHGAGLSWDAMIADDLRHLREVGNDHRFLGLWRFDIPTLQEYSLTISPALYLLATRTLSRPDTVQDMRNSYLLTHASKPILELLGVRFIVSDEAPDFGRELARLGESSRRVLIELPGANVQGWAVKRIVSVSDATAFLANVRDGADLRTIAFVPDTAPRDGLAMANVEIIALPGRIRLVGRSDGPAFVVLPIQYTRCLRVAEVRAGTAAPRLLRTDLALAGLAFDGPVDATLTAALGLGHGARCLLDEVADLRRLDLSQAARAFPPGSLATSRN
jgi:hypothetical protein